MTTYIELGTGGGAGSPFFGDPVPNFASLPTSGQVGELRITLDTGVLYYWDGLIWNVSETEVATIGHTDTNSIDISTPGSILQADLNISPDAATGGYLKATTTIKTGAGKGLHIEVPIATTSVTGVVTDTDWDTFNNKEPAITAATTGDYYRGDKSFQPLNIDAMAVLVGGALNTGAKLLGIETAEAVLDVVVAPNVWGSAVSLPLPAGTWLCFGVAAWEPGTSDLIGYVRFGISKSASGIGIGDFDYQSIGAHFFGGGFDYLYNVPLVILTDAAPFTAHLNTYFSYTTNDPSHGGKIIAVRIR